MHFPGFDGEATQFLLNERDVAGVGIDTHGVDPGQDASYATNTQVLARQGIVLENLTHLDQLPATGTTLVIGILRLEGGFLLSDLCLRLGEEEAWVDHLLIHRYGFTLIESRTLCVPCTRTFEGRWLQKREEGLCEVPSPVERVRQNAHVVLGLLRDQQEHLLEDDRESNVISKLSVDVYVSIALQGDLLTEDVGFSSLVVNVQELGGLVNAKHTERYFAERGRLPKERVHPPLTLDADERLELGEVLLRQHQPGIGKYDEVGVARYFGRRDTETKRAAG